jgi:hypothetical protein
VRTVRAILSLPVLLWGFLQAPFDHIHPEELEHQAVSTPVHFHLHGAGADNGPQIGARTADDDEVDVLWSVVTSSHVVIHADAEAAGSLFIPAPLLAAAMPFCPRPRGHDPPESSPKIPRAPPA